LFIVPVGDTPSHLVAEVPDVLSTNNPPRFDWLADNRRIVAGVERTAVQGVHLWVVDTQSGDMRPLTSGAGGENTAAVSPDGRRIAYATQDTNFDLIEVPLDGSSPRQILATSRNESEPGWSPVSAQYAFVTDRNGRPEIWLRSRDGAWERPLVTDESFAHEVTHTFRLPVFSPDGQRIAFERVTSSGAVLWIATLAGGPPVQATKGEPGLFISNYSPTWSPDGEWIAFVDVRPGKWSLAKVRVGTGSRPQILHDVTGLAHPQWSPDNRWIACMTDQGLTLIAPDGKSARVLREGEIWTVYGWSTDASTLYGVTQSDDSRRLILVAVDVASGRERVINDNLAPMPPVNAPIKGFSRISDKSFATSLVHVRSDLWLIDDFVPPPSLIDRFWSRNLLTTWRTQNNPRSP
jgi:Tol biopolymer transport system component